MEACKKIDIFNALNAEETRDVTLKCDRHGIVKTKILKVKNTWSKPACGKCFREEMKLKNLQEQQNLTQEKQQKKIDDLLAKALIPRRYKSATLKNYSPGDKTQTHALKICKRYVETFKIRHSEGMCLQFAGNVGTGKTHLANAILRAVIEQYSCSALFLKASAAVNRVNASFNNDSQTKQDAINALVEPDLLVLDEIEKTNDSAATKKLFFDILDARYDEIKPTIIITNLANKELESFLGAAISSRLKENRGLVLDFLGDDYRTKK